MASEKRKLQVKQASTKWRQANPEKAAAKEARRRARKREALISAFTSEDLIRRFRKPFNCQCAYCKKPLVYRLVEWDHIIPLVYGGEHSLRNLVPSCQGCNRSKNDSRVFEWLKDSDRSIPYWLLDLLTVDWFLLAYAKTL